VWVLRGACHSVVLSVTLSCRLPSHVHEQLQRIVATQHRLRVELQRDASLEEVSQAVGLTEDKVSEILSAASAAGSLEVPALAGGDGSASELKDMIMVSARGRHRQLLFNTCLMVFLRSSMHTPSNLLCLFLCRMSA
jgi:DNA-directed RNA polymerase sigma subunit (sigma70/sigma32)